MRVRETNFHPAVLHGRYYYILVPRCIILVYTNVNTSRVCNNVSVRIFLIRLPFDRAFLVHAIHYYSATTPAP